MNHPPALHTPVLYDDVCTQAHVSPGEVWVDCTLGRGGHCLGFLNVLVRLFCMLIFRICLAFSKFVFL